MERDRNDESWSEKVISELNSVVVCLARMTDGNIRHAQRKRETGSQQKVYPIAFPHNNHWLASGRSDAKVRLWDLHADSLVPRALEGHTGEVLGHFLVEWKENRLWPG